MSGLLFLAILLFLSPRAVFKNFKGRYSVDQIAFLNETLAVRGKLNRLVLNLVFLRRCMSNAVVPKKNSSKS